MEIISKKTQYFVSRFNDICSKYKLDMSADSEGGMFGIYLTKSKLKNLNDIDKSPKHIFLDFFNYMLDHGVFFAPSMYEAGFISSSHLKKDLDYTSHLLVLSKSKYERAAATVLEFPPNCKSLVTASTICLASLIIL